MESPNKNLKREESEFGRFHVKGTFVDGVFYNKALMMSLA